MCNLKLYWQLLKFYFISFVALKFFVWPWILTLMYNIMISANGYLENADLLHYMDFENLNIIIVFDFIMMGPEEGTCAKGLIHFFFF